MSTKHALIAGAVGAFGILASALAFNTANGQNSISAGYEQAVDAQGNIRLPNADYRKDWVSLGSWAVAAEEGTQGSQGIHAVYAELEAVEAYRKTGSFPDGAVLIKELLSTKTEEMTTGTVSRADKTTGWFVMVKDAKGRYPANKLWGDGWGWAYFNAKSPGKSSTTDYDAECKGCHVPAQKTDWIYVDAYPVLKAP